MDKILPLVKVAQHFGVSAVWLTKEAKAGRVPFLQAGPHILMNLESVEQSLLGRTSMLPLRIDLVEASRRLGLTLDDLKHEIAEGRLDALRSDGRDVDRAAVEALAMRLARLSKRKDDNGESGK